MIAVTGANGLLGSHIIRKLLGSAIPFVAIRRNNSDLSLIHDVAGQITWREGDVTDALSMREALKDATGVIHTAAYVSFNPRRAKTVFAINTTGTQHVVDACLHNGVQRLLHISSVAALGRQKNQTHITEENKWAGSNLHSNYAESKYLAELEVFRGQEEGLSTVIVNPSVILGSGDWNKSSSQLFRYVSKEWPFYINGSLNYVDARDVADVVLQLYNAPVQAERFITNAGSLTFKSFFQKVAAALQKKEPTIQVSPLVAKILAVVEEARCRMVGAEPIITRETARLANSFFEYDNQKVRKALNFNFQSIDATLDWCCQHYSQSGK